ncbi:MAG: hypothetical protein FVQ81_10630 [Candidatus Glassbacteria bacterium]|nr:hypothetical protein [Candidatus Glassbacteria bacterium]
MDFKSLWFQSRSRKGLRQIYAVIFYMKNGSTRLESVYKTARYFSVTYQTINDQLARARHFAGKVDTFERWYKSGELLDKLRRKFKLSDHDFEVFRTLLEEDVTKSTLFSIIQEDLKSMEAEEKKPVLGPTGGLEGKQSLRMIRYFERNSKLRTQTINFHGLECTVCGFNFEKVYGKRGESFIEVHHHRPISSYEGKIKVDPKNDMTVLCSNCHMMIHRFRSNLLTIEELKEIINNRDI